MLDRMLREQPLHYKYQVIEEEKADPGVPGRWTWEKMYEGLEDGHIYVKIDDDVVFIKDGAIEEMLDEHFKRRFLFVSANVVNHPWLSHIHHRMGATLPFHPPSLSLLEDWHLKSGPRDWVLRPQPNGLEDTVIGRSPCVPLSSSNPQNASSGL
ncbi:hypothetical protein MMC29_003691 [Sticta canariensis]|nr:hypothetical protein [Sticta canariensis]